MPFNGFGLHPEVMQAIILSVVFFVVFVIPAVTVLLIVKMIVKTIVGRGGAKTPKATAEEARMIQEIYQGLMKMDQRIEALETLMLRKD